MKRAQLSVVRTLLSTVSFMSSQSTSQDSKEVSPPEVNVGETHQSLEPTVEQNLHQTAVPVAPMVQTNAASLEELNKYIAQLSAPPVAVSTQGTTDQQQQALWQQALQTLAAGSTFMPQQPLAAAAPSQQPLVLPAILPQVAQASSTAALQGSNVSTSPGTTEFPTASNTSSSLATGPVAPKRPLENSVENEDVHNAKRQAPISMVSLASSDQPPPQQLEELARQHPNWDSMTPAEKRRQERNLREQQRSYLISQQIKKLRDVLTESNVPFKPNKFSILVSVVDYIKSLQSRAIMLDSEHQKLLDTMKGTNEMVANGQLPDDSEKESIDADSGKSTPDLLMVQGIDYRSVFEHCPCAIGVASLDGRILACNEAFEKLLAMEEAQDVANQSFFVYIRNHQDVFDAMADLLKRSSAATETGEGVVKEEHLLYWCGRVVSLKSQQVSPRLFVSF